MGFLNFDKVQKDFLSEKLKATKKGNFCEWFTAHDESRAETYVSNGQFFAVIPDEICFIQEETHSRGIKPESLKRCIPETEGGFLHYTGTIKKIDKINAYIFTTADGEEIWIAEKYYKYFENMNCHYCGSGAKSAVVVYVLDRIVGLILPVNHR